MGFPSNLPDPPPRPMRGSRLGPLQAVDTITCWNCGESHDGLRVVDHTGGRRSEERPYPGAWNICGTCNAPGVFRDGLKLDPPTPEEAASMLGDRFYVASFFVAWLTRHNIRPPV